MDLHDEQKENILKERYYESLIGKDYAKGMDFILPSLVRFDHVRGQFKIQETVGISKKLQSYLKNHFGDAWKQKTMAYFISNRINPIFGTVEYFRKLYNSEPQNFFRSFSVSHFRV